MKINCVIIDDEPLAIKVIENHLQEFKNIKIIGRYGDPLTAFSIIDQNLVDVIFLDINMPKINGLEFIKNASIAPYIIITTAYREFAAESYDLNVLDYLVKPIPFPRFLKSINKLTKELSLREKINPYNTKINSYIFLKVDKKLVKIKYKDILYIESLKDYIKVRTDTNKFIVHKSLTGITEELPNDKFIRIHRSYTIAIEKINSVEGNLIEVGSKKIPIGRKYINQTKKIILKQ